ncbi:MAG: glycosyltransferase family A protein [Cyanobacteria bacterium P01_G01_bin.19]
MPQVSIIIPTYNMMAYLPETIGSVLAQTYTDFELIVVDDGSKDNTSEWVDQLSDPRIRLITQANMGLAGAINTGITNSQGEYIALIDADDLWSPTKLEQQVAVLDHHPEVGIVNTWVTYMNDAGASTGRIVKSEAEGYIWQDLIKANQIECGSVALIRRSCFDEVGLFQIDLNAYGQDWDMWLRLALKYQFKVIRQPLVYYRQRASSSSRNLLQMERGLNVVLAKAEAAAPKELKSLVKHGYSFAYFCLAWKALQNTQPDSKAAQKYHQIALGKDPQKFWTKENLRLTTAIALMRIFGQQNYLKILDRMQSWRSKLTPASAIEK